MGNKNIPVARNEVYEDTLVVAPQQKCEETVPEEKNMIPLNERSNKNVGETCQKETFAFDKANKPELKERPKLGELKVKKVKEMKKLNKENETEMADIEPLNMKNREKMELPVFEKEDEEKPKSISENMQSMLRTNESEARTKKCRISKML